MIRKKNSLVGIFFTVLMILLQNSAIAQKSCAFIGAGGGETGDSNDSLLIVHLQETYDVTIVDDDSIMNGTFTKDDLSTFDFGFVSESASTWRLKSAPDNFYKTSPVPMFYTELYASQPSVAGWVDSTSGSFGTTNDSTGVGGKIVIVDDTGHPLSAGFANNTEIEVVDSTSDETKLGMLTFCTPKVEYTPIAVYGDDPSLSIAFGIEPGTKLYDSEGIAVQDTLVTSHRIAAVGVFAKANNFITADGFALIDAGLDWILDEPTEDFVNTEMTSRSAFVAVFQVIPSNDSLDGVIGFSKVNPTSYADFSIKILFNNEGKIVAADGSDYGAVNEVLYEAGKTYVVRLVTNILEQDYSVWVNNKLIGENLAFSSGPGVVDSLNYRSVKMSFGQWGGNLGTLEIPSFITQYPDGNNINTKFEPQSESFMLEFNARSTADSVDGVIGFSKAKPGNGNDYSQPVKLLFNNGGFVTANNAGTFESVNPFPYTGGENYKIRMIFHMDEQTFDAWIAPEGGKEVRIAKAYGFTAEADTLQWRTIVMAYGLPWAGVYYGFVETTDYVFSEAPGASVAFIGSAPDPGDVKDSLLIAHLNESYDVTIVDDHDIMNGVFTEDDLSNFDFGFVSESASGYRLTLAPGNFYRVAPIPMFYTELYATQPAVAGWVSATGDYGTVNDSLGDGSKILIVNEENHDLAAGFAIGTEIEVVNGTSDSASLAMLTYCVPEIDYIPIGVYVGDTSKAVVIGVEVGTKVFDSEGTAVQDTLVTLNRAAAVGIHAKANDYITTDGYALIDAGIDWILSEPNPTGVERNNLAIPEQFALEQNYPNPFNPTTKISFSLSQTGFTTLTVYNSIGQEITKLVNKDMKAGQYTVDFNASNLSSGVYFYKINTNDFTKVRKMMLIK